METRFQWSQEIADNLTDERFRLLAARLDFSWLADEEFAVVVFNGLGWDLSEIVTVNLDVPYNFWARLALQRAQPPREWNEHSDFLDVWARETWRDWAGDPPVLPSLAFKGLLLRTVDGLEVPAEIEDVTMTVVGQNLLSGPRAAQSVLRIRATFPVQALPAYGYQVLAGRLTAQPIKHDRPRHPTNVMENEHLRVEIQPNGTLDVTDKATGQRYTDLGYFEDGGDCGDGYNYSYPPHDAVFNTLSARPRIACLSDGPVVQRYRIEYDLELPAGLTEDRKRRRTETVHCPLTVTISLGTHARRVDFEATLENRARDHRLRVLFPSDVQTDVSYSDTPFDVVPHPVHPEQPSREVWWEDQPVTYPQQTFVDVSDGQRGLCVISYGLPEYEVVNSPRREVAITLLRAVGYLGAGDDLYTIRSGAGPRIATPGGQCLRTFTYRYAIMPHAGTWEQMEVWREAYAHSVRPRALVAMKHPDFPVSIAPMPARVTLPYDRHSFLSVTGHNAVLSAVKRAERDDALIVRLFNPSTEPTLASVYFACALARAELVNLNEEPLGQTLAIDGEHRISIPIAPKRIMTIQVTPVRK
jgi:alpha-mannosidase